MVPRFSHDMRVIGAYQLRISPGDSITGGNIERWTEERFEWVTFSRKAQ
jgi:hypothetical protein